MVFMKLTAEFQCDIEIITSIIWQYKKMYLILLHYEAMKFYIRNLLHE